MPFGPIEGSDFCWKKNGWHPFYGSQFHLTSTNPTWLKMRPRPHHRAEAASRTKMPGSFHHVSMKKDCFQPLAMWFPDPAAFMLPIALRRCLTPRKALCQKTFNLETYWKGLWSYLIWYCSEGEKYWNLYRKCIPYIVTGQSFRIVTGVPSEP